MCIHVQSITYKMCIRDSTTSDAKKNILLSPDEQAVYNKNDKVLSMRKIDAVSQAAWTTGRPVSYTHLFESAYELLSTLL